MEIDKQIDTIRYSNCEFDQGAGLLTASASVNKMILDRCYVTAGFGGTAKDITIRDSYISGGFILGPVFGATERMTVINTHINHLTWSNMGQGFIPTTAVTFVNGTIKVPPGSRGWSNTGASANNPLPCFAPGTKAMIQVTNVDTSGDSTFNVNAQVNAAFAMMTTFQILDVYVDGSGNYCADTTLPAIPVTNVTVTGSIAAGTNQLVVTAISPAGACLLTNMPITNAGLPAGTTITQNLGVPNYVNNLGTYLISNTIAGGVAGPATFIASMPVNLQMHPCPRLNIIGCTGGKFATSMSGAPLDSPIFTYFRHAYGGFEEASYAAYTRPILAGSLLSWDIDVVQPYTGAQSTYICYIGIFGYANSGNNWYPTFVNQQINLKLTGKRTIAASTTTGAQAGDTLTPAPFFLTGGHAVIIGPSHGSDTLDKMPYFIMTGRARQGVEGATLSVNTIASGIGMDTFADSVMSAGFN